MTPNPSRPAAVDALPEHWLAIADRVVVPAYAKAARMCAYDLQAALAASPAPPAVDALLAWLRGVPAETPDSMTVLSNDSAALTYGDMRALATHHGPAAVDEAMVERAYRAWQTAVVDERHVGNRESLRIALEAALAKPAQETAPQGGGEAIAWEIRRKGRVRALLSRPPADGEVQYEEGETVRPLYAAPPAAQASDENALEGIAQAAAALDVLDRKPLAAWLMRIHAGMAQASEDRAGKDGERLS